jgi:starch synthase
MIHGRKPMRILMVASESLPLVKTGGLADVVVSLSKALVMRGHQVDVMIPEYNGILNHYEYQQLDYFQVPIATQHDEGFYKTTKIDGIRFILVSSDYYFSRPGSIYGHGDDFERFELFQLAALEFLRYQDYDVLHCHDWHTGLLPYMVKTLQQEGILSAVKTVFTIHNLAFQGVFELGQYKRLFLPYSTDLEMHGWMNFMKTGIITADVVTTVSPTYAKEILDEVYGEGLQDILRMRKADLVGILNGLDYSMFDPRRDTMILSYDGRTVRKGKSANKHRLQNEMGLPEHEGMMMGMVSRLSDQKGFDLIVSVLPQILDQYDIQLVIVGSGDARVEDQLRDIEARYPTQCKVHIGYSEQRARLVYAASDVFLMPSRFEPCGLSQMIAMRYGTLPIVRRTGGLADTVIDQQEDGVGIVFDDYTPNAFHEALLRAIHAYAQPAWSQRVKAAMKLDNSWTPSAKQYESIYKGH